MGVDSAKTAAVASLTYGEVFLMTKLSLRIEKQKVQGTKVSRMNGGCRSYPGLFCGWRPLSRGGLAENDGCMAIRDNPKFWVTALQGCSSARPGLDVVIVALQGRESRTRPRC